MRNFYILLAAALTAGPLTARACDLCGCYTPQIEAMPQSAAESPFGQPAPVGGIGTGWLARTYFALAEQFTRFGTVQVNGNEIPNLSDQYLNSAIRSSSAVTVLPRVLRFS